jgi:VIT1/CCC1 family predicted Fe2+/Mn2+ transporter
MPRYLLIGQHAYTGEDVYEEIEDDSDDQVRAEAEQRNILVTDIMVVAAQDNTRTEAQDADAAPTYTSIRKMHETLGFIGALLVVVGIFTGVLSLLALIAASDPALSGLLLTVCLGLCITGILLVVFGYILHLLRDIAINTWHTRRDTSA